MDAGCIYGSLGRRAFGMNSDSIPESLSERCPDMVKTTSLPGQIAAAKRKFNEAVRAIERELAGRRVAARKAFDKAVRTIEQEAAGRRDAARKALNTALDRLRK